MEQSQPQEPPSPVQNPPAAKVLRRRPGFTLVEVWIGVLVTVAIAGLSLAAFRGKTKLSSIRAVRDTISADIRAMQQYSLAGKATSICVVGGKDESVCRSDTTCSTCESKVPSGGYGVYLVPCTSTSAACTYNLFADLDGDGYYSGNEMLDNGSKTMERPVRATLLYVYYTTCGRVSPTKAAFTFAAYSGEAALTGDPAGCGAYGGASEVSSGEVTIGTGSGQTARIIIRAGGGGIQEQ